MTRRAARTQPSARTAAAPPAPRQARSRETLERILAAAEALLAERLFEELTMAAVAERAGVAVGTIYTRFRTKEDLLPALFERHDAAVGGRVARLLDALDALGDGGRPRALRERLEAVVTFAVDYHRRHRGLLRALTQYVRAHPGSVPAAIFEARTGQYRAVAERVVGDGRGLAHEDPVAAVELALGVLNSVCREQLLFDDVTPLRGRRPGRAALVRHLTDFLYRGLAGRVRQPPPSSSKP